MLKLKEPFSSLWEHKDPFEEVEHLDGPVFRQLEKRRTLRFFLNENPYFIKLHYGTSIKEIIKNLVTLKLPIIDAKREWDAIHRLRELGVDTMNGRAFGARGLNPLTRKSFIITEELTPTVSLEDFCKPWIASPPKKSLKRAIIKQLAITVRNMHQGGVNHRDCYLCHFLMSLCPEPSTEKITLSIIDLHRAQIRKQVPTRWRDKDLIGLYFSSLNIGLTKSDIFYFLTVYFGSPLKEIIGAEEKLLIKAKVKALKIQRRTNAKGL